MEFAFPEVYKTKFTFGVMSMEALNKIRQKLSSLISAKETEPAEAYDIWAKSYDAQPGNLMLDLDEELFSALLQKVDIKDKTLADIGCGTGRHWATLYTQKPSKIVGFDVSEGMLSVLKQKFPKAETIKLTSNLLSGTPSKSFDIIVSTLALAHIENIEEALVEWVRVLKPNGTIILTDYHPDALKKGGNRTFVHEGKHISVKNYVHTLTELKIIANGLNLQFETLLEKSIDDSVKPYYEKQDALHVFQRFKGTPIIYGAIITRKNASA